MPMRTTLIILITLLTRTTFAQWTNLTSGTSEWLRAVWFTHADTGYVVGYNGKIIKTVDGGLNWTPQTSNTTNHLQGVFFISSSIGWAVGNGGTIIKTTNSGANWTFQTCPISSAILHEPFFVDLNNGYIAGENGVCLKTIDGGLTWTTMTINSGNGKVSLFFNDINTGYISGLGFTDAIIKTTDGGSTWSNIYSNTIEEFSSICFTSVNDGFAVSSVTGKIASTNNAGSTWNTQLSGATSLYSIQFPSPSTGFAVGGYPSNSSIVTTTNGGVNWSTQLSSTTQPLFGVFFVNNSLGYAVGKNGAIIKTTNGGVGIKEYEQNNLISIYPNPSNGNFSIASVFPVTKIKLFDSNGKCVKEQMIFDSKPISTSDLVNGIYLLEITSDKGTGRKKLIIQAD